MSPNKTVVLLLGLPYTGKTSIIRSLLEIAPGEALYIDGIFRDLVPESEVCLERWLAEGPHFVERISARIDESPQSRIYVELGIMQQKYRRQLMKWILDQQYSLVPIVLQCDSRDVIEERVAERHRALTGEPDKTKIRIGSEELFGKIHAVFEDPEDSEGFQSVDTSSSIDTSVANVLRLMAEP